MKVENRYTRVSIKIICLFVVAIFASFVPENLHDFFGDEYCKGSMFGCLYHDGFRHGPSWHWGYRHWLWLSMGVCLAGVQIVNIINDATE